MTGNRSIFDFLDSLIDYEKRYEEPLSGIDWARRVDKGDVAALIVKAAYFSVVNDFTLIAL